MRATVAVSIGRYDAYQDPVSLPLQTLPEARLTVAPDPPSGMILVVDDEESNRALMTRLLTADGYQVHCAADGKEALAAVERVSPDLILLDVQIPFLDGFQVCRRLKDNPDTRLIPIVIVTGLHDREHRIQGIDAGADDFIGKPFDRDELRARIRSLVRLKRFTSDLESAESIIFTLAVTVEARDPYTKDHCERLACYATALGRELGLSNDELAALYRGGYLHDVGKIGIPDALLLKAGRLTEGEFELMKQHTIIGERLCGNLRSLALVRPIVRHHHERLNGQGYPDRLSGDLVPLLAQIVGIVDVYDALTTPRPYRAAWSVERAFEELQAQVANGSRRADLVETFIRLARTGALAEQLKRSRRQPGPAVSAAAR